jgi:hypothetical protein
MAGENAGTSDDVLPALCGARKQLDEKEIILHDCVDLSLKVSAESVSPFPKLVRLHERRSWDAWTRLSAGLDAGLANQD